jgi:hypothetical protein
MKLPIVCSKQWIKLYVCVSHRKCFLIFLVVNKSFSVLLMLKFWPVITPWDSHVNRLPRRPDPTSTPTLINIYEIKFHWCPTINPQKLNPDDLRVGVRMRVGFGRSWTVGVRSPAEVRFLSSPKHPDRLWGRPILISNGYRGLLPRG